MNRPFQPIGKLTAAVVRDRSLTFFQAEFHKAEVEADACLEAVAEFSCQAKLWLKADIVAMAALNERAYVAEHRRHQAHARLLREFLEFVTASGTGEEVP